MLSEKFLESLEQSWNFNYVPWIKDIMNSEIKLDLRIKASSLNRTEYPYTISEKCYASLQFGYKRES